MILSIGSFAQQDEMWGDQVTVAHCDMREFNPQRRQIFLYQNFWDLLVTMSYHQNVWMELRNLKEDGVSIPSSYTSYIVPVSAPKLYSEIAQMREKDKHPLTYFEMPYVVHLHNHTPLSSPKELFKFVHPNRVEVPDNTRYGKLNFTIPYNCSIHGFAGYLGFAFFLRLILLDCLVGFPYFSPIKDPLNVNAKQELDVHFWRCVSPRNVWYEWMISKPIIGAIHNPCGRSYTIGL
ncbi:protein arginine N-methyltransferase 5 [Caerostris extrusa]|uniref:Protein arginine N-methyltransferase 5 n=1 Tax=Caerostris extrusa TaxID=172846 RepID=A0AAV4NJN8_CAEEX|nr:protein arginine N-methyltransferase 5 [Caerostris extrusa]